MRHCVICGTISADTVDVCPVCNNQLINGPLSDRNGLVQGLDQVYSRLAEINSLIGMYARNEQAYAMNYGHTYTAPCAFPDAPAKPNYGTPPTPPDPIEQNPMKGIRRHLISGIMDACTLTFFICMLVITLFDRMDYQIFPRWVIPALLIWGGIAILIALINSQPSQSGNKSNDKDAFVQETKPNMIVSLFFGIGTIIFFLIWLSWWMTGLYSREDGWDKLTWADTKAALTVICLASIILLLNIISDISQYFKAKHQWATIQGEYESAKDTYGKAMRTYENECHKIDEEYADAMKAYREQVLAIQNQNQKISDDNKALTETKNRRHTKELADVRSQLQNITQTMLDESAAWYPPDYYSLDTVDEFRRMIRNHQIDSVKEMVQLFTEHEDRKRILESTGILAQQFTTVNRHLEDIVAHQQSILANQEELIAGQADIYETLYNLSATTESVGNQIADIAENQGETNSMLDSMQSTLRHADSVATANLVVDAITMRETMNVSNVASAYAARTQLR